MRILYISNTLPPDYTGGAEVSAYHTARGMQARGAYCTFLSINSRLPQASDSWYDLNGVPVHRVRFRKRRISTELFDWRVFRAVLHEIQYVKPDLVHIHNISGATLALHAACKVANIPVVNTLHDLGLICPMNNRYQQDGSYCDPRRFPNGCGNCFRRYDYWAPVPQRTRLLAFLTTNVRYFIAPSQALINRFVEAGYDRQRFRMIYNGIAEDGAPKAQHPEVQRVIAERQPVPTIMYAGGGVEIKGPHVVLEALPQLLAAMPNLQLIIAGGGEEALLHPFKQYESNVTILGRVPFTDMHALYANVELTLVPSVWHENSPTVIYENFQLGTPVVGSNFGGTPELIEDNVTGYLFPTGNAAEMAEKILHHFQRSSAERRRMRQCCVDAARTRLVLARHLDAVAQVYKEVLN